MRPEIVDRWLEEDVTQPRGSHRDPGSRGLDSKLRHGIPFQIACSVKKTSLGIAKQLRL